MATTIKSYRLRGRNVRWSTQLQSMANGMYLTDQNIPEGFAKVMVNYDIDTTGSCIRTKKGRNLHETKLYTGDKYNLGPMHLTDYIYTYNQEVSEINDIKDLLMSFGKYSKLSDYIDPTQITIPANHDKAGYMSRLIINTDNSVYDDEGEVITPGEVVTERTDGLWALYCDRGSESFNKIHNDNIGYVSARTIKNAYVFDKKVVNDLGLPIYTVLNNETYAFSGDIVEATYVPSNSEKNTFNSLSDTALTKLKVYEHTVDDYRHSIKREVIEPRNVSVTEAQTEGFNMLKESPYLFNDVPAGAPKVLGFFLYPDINADIPIYTPTVGETYSCRIYYQYMQAGETYQYKVTLADATNSDSQVDTIIDWTNYNSGDPLNFDVKIPYVKTDMHVYIRKASQTSTESTSNYVWDSTAEPIDLKEYDLTTAKGMISWMGCIGLYGVKEAPETIFFSSIENPSYFPYPNNTIAFDNEILAVHNYLDMLLVITTDSIYIVTVGNSIRGSILRKVMTNIYIPEVDAINAIVLKDQIFFKTDTQFYVLKPNKYTSDATDLKNYTNSTAIAHYTIHFTEETLKILNRVFRPITNEESKLRRKTVHFTDFDVTNIQSMVKEEEVHYVYTIIPYIEEKQFGNLDLHLIYNTVTRSYRLYLVGIGNDYVSHTAKLYRNKQSGAFYEVFPHNKETSADMLIIKESLKGRDDDVIMDDWHLTPYYNNYNYIDTGNVALEDITNKRFRELQMNIVNKEDSRIRFYTDVKVDGKLNVTSTRYQIENVTDPDDPDYGLVYVIPTEVDELKTMMVAYGNTALECEEQELVKYWEVDLSAFPDLDTATIKLKLWGKGRRVAFQMLCTDLKNYEITSLVWVYRTMNVR